MILIGWHSVTAVRRVCSTQGWRLAAELSLPALLQRIVDLAVDLTDARYGALGVLSPDGSDLSDFITSGLSAEQRAAIGELPHGLGILGVLIREPAVLRIRDIADDARATGFPPNHPSMHSFLGAPIRAHGRVFGNIYLTDKRGAREFTAGRRGGSPRACDPSRRCDRQRATVRGAAATRTLAGLGAGGDDNPAFRGHGAAKPCS